MTSSKIASTLFAALFASASFAAAAGAATTTHPVRHPRSAVHHAAKGPAAARKDSGDAAVDALNQQSLDAARSGQAPAGAAPASTAQ